MLRRESRPILTNSPSSGGGAAVTARHYNLYAYADEKRDALARWAARLEDLFGLTPGGESKDA